MINTEIMVKLARSGCLIVEVGVNHFPRTAGAPQGAKLRVIARALREVKEMYPHLSGLAPHAQNAALRCGTLEVGPTKAEVELDTLAIAQERWGTSVPGPLVEPANGHASLVLAEELGRRTGSSTR
jgi:hypothetical protein